MTKKQLMQMTLVVSFLGYMSMWIGSKCNTSIQQILYLCWFNIFYNLSLILIYKKIIKTK